MSRPTETEGEKLYFEEQRELLTKQIQAVRSILMSTFTARVSRSDQVDSEIGRKYVELTPTEKSLENVLQNLNKLNRGLEGITSVGSELAAVEALWSHFESAMGPQATTATSTQHAAGDEADEKNRDKDDLF